MGYADDWRSPVSQFERHVFVCTNARPEGAPRCSCTKDGKGELVAALQQQVREAGIQSTVRINKAGCLDQCEHGPVIVVYPEAVWYGNVQAEDAVEIVREHLVGGRPVSRLRLHEDCINTKECPHRG